MRIGTSENSSAQLSEDDAALENDAPVSRRFPWRAMIVGLLMIPLLVVWSEYTETVSEGADLVAMSLVMCVLFALLVVVAINVVLKKFAPRWAFDQSELIFIYTINSTSVGICGIGMMQFLNAELAGAAYYATPQNGWDKFLSYIRPWAVPDPSVVKAYYIGQTTFFTADHMRGWMMPILVWTAFIFVLLFGMYCVGVLLRRQWVDRERLLFPIVVIPLEITRNGGDSPLWRSKPFWFAAVLAMVLESLAALHYTINPAIPYVPIKPSENAFNIGQNLVTPPWNGVGYLVIGIYPLVIGLIYLLSLDVSFSCWFFYVVLKLENVLAVQFGFRDPGASSAMSRIPYTDQQDIGAFVGLALIALSFAWPHFKAAFLRAFMNKGDADDRDEPMTYRAAYLGLAFSFVFVIGFGVALGMSLLVSTLFFALSFLFFIAFTRIRAEAGVPWGGGPPPYVHGTLVDMGGPQSYNTSDLTAISYFHWFDSDYRALAMPSQLEAMKLANVGGLNPRHLTVGVLAAILVATLSSWGAELEIYYHYGAASAHVNDWRTAQGHYHFDQLMGWLNNPKPPDSIAIGWSIVGLLVTLALGALRANFVWWPLHPIGYAVANSGTMDWMWAAVFLGWLSKYTTLRYGGIGAYRKALPFFLGLVIGDYLVSSVWALFYLFTGLPGYRTFPI